MSREFKYGKPRVSKAGPHWIVQCAEKGWIRNTWVEALAVAIRHFDLHPDHSQARGLLRIERDIKRKRDNCYCLHTKVGGQPWRREYVSTCTRHTP